MKNPKPSFSMSKWTKEFDKKISTYEPDGWWIGVRILDGELDKDGIKSFIKDLLASQREEIVEQIKAKTIIEPQNDYWDYFRRFLDSFSKNSNS